MKSKKIWIPITLVLASLCIIIGFCYIDMIADHYEFELCKDAFNHFDDCDSIHFIVEENNTYNNYSWECWVHGENFFIIQHSGRDKSTTAYIRFDGSTMKAENFSMHDDAVWENGEMTSNPLHFWTWGGRMYDMESSDQNGVTTVHFSRFYHINSCIIYPEQHFTRWKYTFSADKQLISVEGEYHKPDKQITTLTVLSRNDDSIQAIIETNRPQAN